MGLKHLGAVMDYLRKHRAKAFSKGALRDALKINNQTMKDNIAFLLQEGLILEINDEGTEKYKWKGRKVP